MLSVMERVRVGILINEETRDVLRLEALLTGKDMGEIVEQLVSANLTASVEQIRARRGHEQPKKGKRPKSDD
jgi:hypothetical protein